MKKIKKLLFLSTPIITAFSPIIMVSCVKYPNRKKSEPKENTYFSKYKELFEKLDKNDLDVLEKINYQDYTLDEFYSQFLNKRKVRISENSSFFKSLTKQEKDNFNNNYRLVVAYQKNDDFSITFGIFLVPKDNDYHEKNIKDYFYYLGPKTIKLTNFKNHDEIKSQKEKTKKIWTILQITIPTIAIIGILSYIIIRIIIKKRKGLRYGK